MAGSRSPTPENDIFSLSLVPERANKEAGTSETTFDSLLGDPLLLHEDLKDGCGGQLWPAGMTLARYMLKYQPDLRSRSVLEIGAGGGLVGLAVAKGCALDSSCKVVTTDQIPMLSLMQRNIALNGLEDKVYAAVYDWGTSMPADVRDSLKSSSPDILLAADCVYFEPAFPLLLSTLEDLIGPRTTCYFCFKKRRKADMRFIRTMMKTFAVEQVEYDDKAADQKQSIWLYKLQQRKVSN